MEHIINQFAEHGVPTLVLGFILWFVLKPIVRSFTKLLDKQTDTLSQLLDNSDRTMHRHEEIHSDIKEIKSGVNSLNQKIK